MKLNMPKHLDFFFFFFWPKQRKSIKKLEIWRFKKCGKEIEQLQIN